LVRIILQCLHTVLDYELCQEIHKTTNAHACLSSHLTLVLIAAGATTRMESKTNINEPIQKIKTSHYSAKMLRLLGKEGSRLCNRPVSLLIVLCKFFETPKIADFKNVRGFVQTLRTPHPTGLKCYNYLQERVEQQLAKERGQNKSRLLHICNFVTGCRWLNG